MSYYIIFTGLRRIRMQTLESLDTGTARTKRPRSIFGHADPGNALAMRMFDALGAEPEFNEIGPKRPT